MKDNEQKIGNSEQNFNTDAKGCFLAFIPGITGLIKNINQRREDAQIRHKQEQATRQAFEKQRSDIIISSVEQHITAQSAGIYLPICKDPFDPIGNHLFEHALYRRVQDEIDVMNLIDEVRQLQKGESQTSTEDST